MMPEPDSTPADLPAPDPRPQPRWGQYADPAPTVPSAGGPAANPASAGHTGFPPPRPGTALPGDPPAGAAAEPSAESAGSGALTDRPPLVNDIALTTGLLALGVWDVVGLLRNPGSLASIVQRWYDQLGIGAFTGLAQAESMGVRVAVAHLVILLAVIALSLVLIARRRRAFWVPLVGGILAAGVLGAGALAVIAADPTFVAFANRSSGG